MNIIEMFFILFCSKALKLVRILDLQHISIQNNYISIAQQAL